MPPEQNPYEPPTHSSPLPEEMLDSTDIARRRRYWTRIALLPLICAVFAMIGGMTGSPDLFFGSVVVEMFAAPIVLLICAVNFPAPDRGMSPGWRIFWRICWFIAALVIHAVALLVLALAGCTAGSDSMMHV